MLHLSIIYWGSNYGIHVPFTAATFSKTEEFIKECIIAKQLDHPNVLGLIGVSIIKKEAIPLMIIPYMHNGDVKSFLKSKREGILYINEAGLPEVCNYMYISAINCLH